ncbi:MAG TPA: TfoX/Sxy family protein [Burkholderiales bacterium]|nr:TfoX/Sxy family protein [Burkholderiales bacterium]
MNEALTQRLRAALKGRKGITEKRMFGGACFMLRGNMLCGTGKSDFMFRVGKVQDADALARPGARPMDITGRKMPGFVWVDAGCDARALKRWIALAEEYVGALPAKKQKGSSKKQKGS